MNHVFFFVGAFVLAAGSAGCAIVLLRYVDGAVPRWRILTDLLFAVSALALGLYLILDEILLLPVGAALVTTGAVYSTRQKRKESEDAA